MIRWDLRGNLEEGQESGDVHTFPDIMHEQFLQLTQDLLTAFKNFILAVEYHEMAMSERLIYP